MSDKKNKSVSGDANVDAVPSENDDALPEGWVRCQSKSRDGAFYYFNTVDGKSTWRKPGTPAQVKTVDDERRFEKRKRDKEMPKVSSKRRRQQPQVTGSKDMVASKLRKEGKSSRDTLSSSLINSHTVSHGQSSVKKVQSQENVVMVSGSQKLMKPKEQLPKAKITFAVGKQKGIPTTMDAVSITAEHRGKYDINRRAKKVTSVDYLSQGSQKGEITKSSRKSYNDIIDTKKKTNSSNLAIKHEKDEITKSKYVPLKNVIRSEIPVLKEGRKRSCVTEILQRGSLDASVSIKSTAQSTTISKSTKIKPKAIGRGACMSNESANLYAHPISPCAKSPLKEREKTSLKMGMHTSSCLSSYKIPKKVGARGMFSWSNNHDSLLSPVLNDSSSPSDMDITYDIECISLPSKNPFNVESSLSRHNIQTEEEVELMDVDNSQLQHTILKEIKEIRSSKDLSELKGDLSQQVLNNESIDKDIAQVGVYIVLDTNILLSYQSFVADLLDYPIPGVGPPTLVIPWMVLKELDSLKDADKNRIHSHCDDKDLESGELLRKLARHAIAFLQNKLEQAHPRLKGETAIEAARVIPGFQEESNDDSILHCCLLYKEATSSVVLLSDDKNLCAKAMIHGVKAFCKKNIVDGLKDLFGSGKIVLRRGHFNEYYSELKKQQIIANRFKKADELLCELKCIVREAFSIIIEEEMKSAYDDLWLEVVAIKPSWTLQDVLVLLEKHWIAVFGHVVNRKLLATVQQLKKLLNKEKRDTDVLKYVREISDLSLGLCQAFGGHSSYNDIMPKCIAALIVVQKNCTDSENEEVPKQDTISDLPMPNLSGQDLKVMSAVEVSENAQIGEEQVPFAGVIDTFNIIWSAVTEMSSLIFESLNYPNPFSSDEHSFANVVVSKDEAIQLLATLCPCLSNVVAGIKSVLEAPLAETTQIEVLLEAVCQFMNKIAKRGCCVTISALKGFCIAQYTRNALIHGLSRLDRALAMLQHCADRLSSQ